MAAVTFAELVDRVRERIRASNSQTVADRQRLLDLIEELRVDHGASNGDDLLTDTGWQLLSIEVQGYAGIGNAARPLVIDLTPTAGITVVRGGNGTGKSSLANAVHSALDVSRASPASGVAGELWRAEAVADGASAATVIVRLGRGRQTLAVSARFTRDEGAAVTATLRGPDGHRNVDLDVAWSEALAGSNACFTYAGLQTRLQTTTHLQSYLEDLLVLGPIWQLVHETLTARAATAAEAKNVLQRLMRDAKQREKACTDRFGDDPRQPTAPPDIDWPRRWTDDVDNWLRANNLGAAAPVASIVVGDDHEERIRTLGEDLEKVRAELTATERKLDSPEIVGIFHHLEGLTRHAELDPAHCPVCGKPGDWRSVVRTALGAVQGRADKVDAVEKALQQLDRWAERELGPLIASGVPGGPTGPAAAFRAAVQREGCRAHGAADRAADDLLAALHDQGHAAWLGRLRGASDAAAEWAAARNELIAPLVRAWRELGSRAAEADGWEKAKRTLTDLQLELRQERQDQLTDRLHLAVDSLLPDAGIEIRKIRHKGGIERQHGVDVELTIGGRPATLGMLSSGQRNALLLASLLCVGGAAPFGFLMIDDPVHALDDLRVDLLARELTRLAQDRQVVVLTHDARLEEHLRARQPDLEVILLERDATTSTVLHRSVSSPWDHLLQQASMVINEAAAQNDAWGVTAPLSDVVGGLCRNALDGAIRQAAITAAVRRGEDVGTALAALGEGRDTRSRIDHILALAGGPQVLPRTTRCCDEHLTRWNHGTHGAQTPGADLRAEIKSAREACRELSAWRP